MGDGGNHRPAPNYFKGSKKCSTSQSLFIADEVQSGFARYRKMFAIEALRVEPDIRVKNREGQSPRLSR